MTRLGMVIDLSKCVGCGACAFACKAENNTRTRGDGQSHNWADFMMRTEGTFPNVHALRDAGAVQPLQRRALHQGLPGRSRTDKAMFKTPEGITMHDPELCIGCRRCQEACPYSHEKLGASSLDGETYSVISFNPTTRARSRYWADKTAAIPGCTSSGAEMAAKAGAPVPAMSKWTGGDLQPIRKDDVVEKCTFCYHRTLNGLQPACVEVCPSQARIFGDQEDPKSQISQMLKKEKSFRLQEEKGTKPNVHYIGKYSARA